MTVPADTILTVSFKCPNCQGEVKLTGDSYALVETISGKGYYTTDVVTIEGNCTYCSEYLILPIAGN